MQRLFDFYNACYNYRWKLKRQDSSATEFPNALVVKSHLQQVDQIVRLMFSYGNYGFSINY